MDTSSPDRRRFLKTSVAVGVGLSILGTYAGSAFAADDAEVSKADAKKPVKSEELFRKGVIGPAELSKAASEIGVEKATDKMAKEFAGFELTEAIAVTTVLKDLGTPVPTPDAKAVETLEKLKSAAKGPEFDKAFITAQLENHEFLRDHAEDYLKKADPKKNAAENQTVHLATLALSNFKEHVAICKRILGSLSA